MSFEGYVTLDFFSFILVPCIASLFQLMDQTYQICAKIQKEGRKELKADWRMQPAAAMPSSQAVTDQGHNSFWPSKIDF